MNIFKKKPALPSLLGESSENTDTAILFVHGFLSKKSTWRKFATTLNLNWKEADSYHIVYDEYYERQNWFDYIPIISGLIRILTGPSITELAEHLKTVIKQLSTDYEHIIIISHSMGGLIARKYILENIKQTKNINSVKCLITYATPHHGTSHANLFSELIGPIIQLFVYGKSTHAIDLAQNSDFINQLNSEWRDFKVDNKIDFIRVVGLNDWVVNTKSQSYLNDSGTAKVANKGHFSIIKPTSLQDTAFREAYLYLLKFKSKLEEKNEYVEEYENQFNQ